MNRNNVILIEKMLRGAAEELDSEVIMNAVRMSRFSILLYGMKRIEKMLLGAAEELDSEVIMNAVRNVFASQEYKDEEDWGKAQHHFDELIDLLEKPIK